MGHARNQWCEPPPLLRLRRCERKRSHRASMKGAQERDHVLPLGVIARQLQRGFHRLSTRIAVIKLMGAFHRSDLRKPFRQRKHALVVKVGTRHVDQFPRLLLNRGDHFRMAMSRRRHRNAGRKVEELVAVDVFDNHATSALRYQRIRPRVRWRNELVVTFQDALGVGAGQSGPDLGTRNWVENLSGHGLLLRNGCGTTEVPNFLLACCSMSYIVRLEKSAGRGSAERMTVTNRRKKDSDVLCREQASSRHAKR